MSDRSAIPRSLYPPKPSMKPKPLFPPHQHVERPQRRPTDHIERYFCDKCGKLTADTYREHQEHLRSHERETWFECRFGCGRRMPERSKMRDHEAIHTGKDHVCRVVMKEATDGAPPWVCGFKTNTYEDTRHHRYKNHGIGSQPLPEGELCAIIPWQSRRREPAQPPPVSQRGVDAAEPRAQIDSSRGGNHVFALSGPSPPSPEGYRSYRFDVEELSTFGPPPVVELGSMLSSTVQSRARAPPEHPPTTAKVTPSAFSFSSWIRTLGPDQPADSGGYLSAGCSGPSLEDATGRRTSPERSSTPPHQLEDKHAAFTPPPYYPPQLLNPAIDPRDHGSPVQLPSSTFLPQHAPPPPAALLDDRHNARERVDSGSLSPSPSSRALPGQHRRGHSLAELLCSPPPPPGGAMSPDPDFARSVSSSVDDQRHDVVDVMPGTSETQPEGCHMTGRTSPRGGYRTRHAGHHVKAGVPLRNLRSAAWE